MPAISAVLGMNGVSTGGVGRTLLDIVFGRSVIILQDAGSALGLGLNIPIPIVGFQYKVSDSVELLKFEWSEYPFLNKQTATNGFVERPRRFTVEGVRPITTYNTALLNFGLNELMITLLKKYVSLGGRFVVVTPWGLIKNCRLEGLRGVKTHDSDFGGQCFSFDFKAYADTAETDKLMSGFLKALGG